MVESINSFENYIYTLDNVDLNALDKFNVESLGIKHVIDTESLKNKKISPNGDREFYLDKEQSGMRIIGILVEIFI